MYHHWLVLGTLLSLIYFNDSDMNVGGMISRFADGTEVGGTTFVCG